MITDCEKYLFKVKSWSEQHIGEEAADWEFRRSQLKSDLSTLLLSEMHSKFPAGQNTYACKEFRTKHQKACKLAVKFIDNSLAHARNRGANPNDSNEFTQITDYILRKILLEISLD